MGYRWFIDDFSGPPHTNLVVDGDCPNKANHTPAPIGYIAKQEWAKRMAKTHRQITCEQCGLWVIWLPKAQARAVLAERKKRDDEHRYRVQKDLQNHIDPNEEND